MESHITPFRILYGVSHVISLTVMVLMIFWLAHYQNGFSWSHKKLQTLNWHPLFMTLGFIYCFGNAITVYRGLRSFSKPTLKIIHTLIHCASIIFVIIGLVAVFRYKNGFGYKNLITIHSWIGITAVALYVLQWTASFFIFLWPGAPIYIRGKLMPVHQFAGFSLFGMSLIAVISGLMQYTIMNNYYQLKAPLIIMNIIGIFIVIFGIIVFFLSTNPKFKRRDFFL